MDTPILPPSLDDLHSDQFVTLSSLPASEQAFAAEFFGWDRATPDDDAGDERRNEDDLLSRYPGLANLDTDMLREIVSNPLTGLMSDADEAVAAANILLCRRQQEPTAA